MDYMDECRFTDPPNTSWDAGHVGPDLCPGFLGKSCRRLLVPQINHQSDAGGRRIGDPAQFFSSSPFQTRPQQKRSSKECHKNTKNKQCEPVEAVAPVIFSMTIRPLDSSFLPPPHSLRVGLVVDTRASDPMKMDTLAVAH